MSENQAMLAALADRLFADLASDPKRGFAEIWTPLAEAGFPALLVPEADGGFGGDWLDAVAVLRLAGYHALPAPLAEAILAGKLLADAGLAAADGLTVTGAVIDQDPRCSGFTGSVKAAWGREADHIVVVKDGTLFRLKRVDATKLSPGESPAGELRDTLAFDGVPAVTAALDADLFALGALTRAALIAGALDGALTRSIQYANDRVQFGKPIGKFQAVQQSLAVFAEEAAAVNCAAQAAARRADRGEAGFEMAAAKLRANMAAQLGHATAHQVHGAIGFTREFGLHRWTRRLLSWSSEFGAERHWAERLGGQVAARGPDALWRDITARSDAG